MLVQVDSENGKSPWVARFHIGRNDAYLLFLDQDGAEFDRLVNPGNGRGRGVKGRPIRWEHALPVMEAALKKPPKGRTGLDLLRHLLSSDDAHVRETAAMAIGREKLAGAELVPDLLRVLDDPYRRAARSAARALGAMGTRAKAAIPALVKQLEPGKRNRGAAAIALGRIDRSGRHAVPALLKLMQDESSELKTAAATGLGFVGEHAAVAVPRPDPAPEGPGFHRPVPRRRGARPHRPRRPARHPRARAPRRRKAAPHLERPTSRPDRADPHPLTARGRRPPSRYAGVAQRAERPRAFRVETWKAMIKNATLSALLFALLTTFAPPADAGHGAPRVRRVKGDDVHPGMRRAIARADADARDAADQYWRAKRRGDTISMRHFLAKYRAAFGYAERARAVLKNFPVVTVYIYGDAWVDWNRLYRTLRNRPPYKRLYLYAYKVQGRSVLRRSAPFGRPVASSAAKHPWAGKTGRQVRRMIAGKRHLGRLEAIFSYTMWSSNYIFVDARGARWLIPSNGRKMTRFSWAEFRRTNRRVESRPVTAPNNPSRLYEVYVTRGKKRSWTRVYWLR